MQTRRFLAAATLAGLIGLAACDGSGEHQVPNEGETQGVGANGTLQDSAAVGEAVTPGGPADAEEIQSNPPALPQGPNAPPSSQDTGVVEQPTVSGPPAQPTQTQSNGTPQAPAQQQP